MLNSVNLIGRVTKDIEVRKTQSNKSVIRFTLAIDRGKDREASFIECQAWEGRADTIAKYVQKGNIVHISGEIINNNYEKDGTKYYSYLVLVNGFTLLPNAKKENQGEEIAPEFETQNESKNGTIDVDDLDLPFY